MTPAITEFDVHVLKAPHESRPHWVSHFIVPSANEVLIRLRTNEGVEGFGLATSYTNVAPIVSVFQSGLAANHGFSIERRRHVPIREEHGNPVAGYLFVLKVAARETP